MKMITTASALHFVVLLGIVNFFGDVTYEGGASINGPFLGMLGGSAAAISIVAGIGEFLGYSLRSVAGYFADKTGRHWLIIFVGYTINLLAVPAMALAPTFSVAASFIIAERIGRALRKPSIEAMLSYTTDKLGKGWAFALNTALDETGATLGPLLIACLLFANIDFRGSYAVLLISAITSLVILIFIRIIFPAPKNLTTISNDKRPQKFTTPFWLNMAAGTMFAMGLMSYELVAFHIANKASIATFWVPILLAFATFCGVIANLILGKCYDFFGWPVLLIAVILSAAFSPLAFLGPWGLIIAAMPFLGIGYATQDTLLKAVIVDLLPSGKRSFSFGIFYTGYGFGWLIGSIVSGLLYQHSLVVLSIFTASVQLISLPLFLFAAKKSAPSRG